MIQLIIKYVGRTIFRDLLEAAQRLMDSPSQTDMWFDGPLGCGKSHVLATLAYLLTGQGYRVVYLPDCHDVLRDSFRYLQHAMLFAWADDSNKVKQILRMKTQAHVKRCFASHARDSSVFFILDHFDALSGGD